MATLRNTSIPRRELKFNNIKITPSLYSRYYILNKENWRLFTEASIKKLFSFWKETENGIIDRYSPKGPVHGSLSLGINKNLGKKWLVESRFENTFFPTNPSSNQFNLDFKVGLHYFFNRKSE